jgi:hypothetical protein
VQVSPLEQTTGTFTRMSDDTPNPSVESDEWLIGLASWVIADGNYSAFLINEHKDFAVEIDGGALAPIRGGSREAERSGDGYKVEGTVLFAEPGLAVVDFGLGAYAERPRADLEVGTSVRGFTRLSVDPFFYFERHALRAEVPALIYRWLITGIWWQTAPYVLGEGRWELDDTKRSWAPLERTDHAPPKWGGHEFLLRCRLLDTPARRTHPA